MYTAFGSVNAGASGFYHRTRFKRCIILRYIFAKDRLNLLRQSHLALTIRQNLTVFSSNGSIYRPVGVDI